MSRKYKVAEGRGGGVTGKVMKTREQRRSARKVKVKVKGKISNLYILTPNYYYYNYNKCIYQYGDPV